MSCTAGSFDQRLLADIPRDLVEVVAGEPLDITIPVLYETGAAVPIPSPVGWSARMQLRAAPYSATVLHEWTTQGATPNAAVIPGVAGAVRLTATAAQTSGWQRAWRTPPSGDLWVTDDLGAPHRILDLVLQLCPSITTST